jgi:dihydrofolate reductase
MNIIVAMCRNKGIGKNGKIPWILKEDMNFFKRKTIGDGNNAVIMGRKTFESLDNKLPKRDNYIISSSGLIDNIANTANTAKIDTIDTIDKIDNLKNDSFLYDNIHIACYDLLTKRHRYDDMWVIGGEQIYSWFLNNNLIKDVYITNVFLDEECDCFFPNLPNRFSKIHSGSVIESKHKHLMYNIDVYRNNECVNNPTYYYNLLRRIDFIINQNKDYP